MILEFDSEYIQEGIELGVKFGLTIARNGHRIKIIDWSNSAIIGRDYPIVGCDLDSPDPNKLLTWMVDGTYYLERGKHPLDLLYIEIYDITSI